MSEVVVDGRYRLVERLGRGGIGEVWSAIDVTTGADVAVKLLRDAHLGNAKLEARFSREGSLLARIDSPRVCRVLAVGTHGGAPYLVVQRIVGSPLDLVLRGGRSLPWDEAAPIIDDILDGLAAVHAASIVHRDLKPANVLVEAGRAKLIDFGISKLLGASAPTLTSAAATLGTPLYMAPEQIGGSGSVDARCDVYAAGTTAYRMLTGGLPFATANGAQALALKQAVPPPTLSERTGLAWPEPLERLLDRMLAIDPSDRPHDATEALAAFRAVSRDLGDFRAPEGGAPEPGGIPSHAETPVLSRRR